MRHPTWKNFSAVMQFIEGVEKLTDYFGKLQVEPCNPGLILGSSDAAICLPATICMRMSS